MATTSNLQLIISAKDEASKTLRTVGDNLAKMTRTASINALKTASGVATKAVLGLGSAFVVAGGFAVKSAADFEQQRVAFETLLGNADKARKLLKQIGDFAAKTPFELPDVVTGSKRLLAFGVAQDDVIGRFKVLGDIALGNRDKMDSLLSMFGKVRAKGTVELEALNIAMDAGVPIISALAKHFKTTESAVFNMVSKSKISFKDFNATLNEMTAEGSMFFNGMDRQSKTFNGVISNVVDNIGKMARTIIGISETGDIKEGSVFARLKAGGEKFLGWLDANKDKITEKIQEFIDKAIAKGKEWYDQMGGKEGIIKKLESLESTALTVANAIAAVAGAIESTANAIGAAKDKYNEFKSIASGGEVQKSSSVLEKIGSFTTGGIIKSVASVGIGAVKSFLDSGSKKKKGGTKKKKKKAFGGSLGMGESAIVGEHRPEVFVPSQSGNIRQLDQAGGRNVNVTFNNVNVRSDYDLDRIIQAVKDTLARDQKMAKFGIRTL